LETQSTIEQIINEDFAEINFKRCKSLLRKGLQGLWLVFSDLIALVSAGFLAIQLRLLLINRPLLKEYYTLIALIILVLIFIFVLQHMYPGVGISPPNEIKKLSLTTSAGMALISIYLFVFQRGLEYSRAVFLLFWVFGLLFVPPMRLLARRIGTILQVWGEPVAIIGQGEGIRKFLKHLKAHRLYGFVPVILVDFDYLKLTKLTGDEKPPVMSGALLLEHKTILNEMGINTAFIIQDDLPKTFQELILYEEVFKLRHPIVISDLGYIGGSAIMPYDLQGVLGLEVQRNLFMRRYHLIKRGINILITLASIPFVFPLFVLLGVLIRSDSPGKIFYSQNRLGYKGQPFKMLKFRTMVNNADQILTDFLEKHPESRAEWEETHKLKDDPRVTRIGRFLRRTSLDELPQLWNVLKGEMSLVGPRPIVQDEIKYYGRSFTTYKKVKPGMTGLWQVSGRSDTSFDFRVNLDEYYVRHWSIWLDFYILMRTLWAVVTRRGAY